MPTAKVIPLHPKKRRRAEVGAEPQPFMGQLVVAVISGIIVALILRKGRR